MNLIPSEAMKRWCVMAMGSDRDITEKCRGPRCMAWRWYESPTVTVTDIPMKDGKDAVTHQAQRPNRVGYCGMAGRPEFKE